MIAGFHVIFGVYGFWLPNDPRGSWSTFVGSWELFRYGAAKKTTERQSLAARDHDRRVRLAAKQALKYPAVEFTDPQILAVAAGFARYFDRTHLPVWACAILPDHVHLVIGRPSYKVEKLVVQIKGDATQELIREGIHPMSDWCDSRTGRHPKCFARGEWKVFLDPEDIPRAIGYVERNPVKEGREAQRWSFVTPYAG